MARGFEFSGWFLAQNIDLAYKVFSVCKNSEKKGVFWRSIHAIIQRFSALHALIARYISQLRLFTGIY